MENSYYNVLETLLLIYASDEGKLKIYLQKKQDEPYKGYWVLPSATLDNKTTLEENAHNLSGGQRQRIVLARMLVNDANLLLIDEGLNQIDVNLERKILKSLFELQKTIVIVSHRIDNMDLYDKVIKIKKGKLDAYLKKEKDNYDEFN